MNLTATALEAALEYAAKGWYVFPVKPGTKVPATEHGFKNASIDPVQIVKWWTTNPDYNVGIATEASNLLVVDFDPRNFNGNELAQEYQTKLSSYYVELEVVTPQGGSHFYFGLPEGPHKKELTQGVDIKGRGGYVLAPPSSTSDGTYNWMATGDVLPPPLGGLQPPPEWLQTLCKPILRPSKVIEYNPSVLGGAPSPTDNRPGSLYNAEASWSEVLTPHGWKIDHVDGDKTYWTRPGKDEGVSAVSGGDEGDYFWTWSTSTNLDADTSYSKFALYTHLNYDGDYNAAAKSLSERYTSGGIKVTGTPVRANGVANDAQDCESYCDVGFLGLYRRYAEWQTDAYAGYHEGAGLALLSVVAGNTRANLSIGKLGLNLFLLLVGASTSSRKSTSQRIATDLLDQVLPDARLPDRMTGEAAIYHLAAKGYQSHIWTPDEFGVTLAQMFAKDSYMKPLEELLLTLYSGQSYAYQTVKNSAHIRGVNLSVLGAATPESLSLAGPQAVLGGLLPRFGVIVPQGRSTPRPLAVGQDLTNQQQELVLHLRNIVAMNATPKLVDYSPGSMDILGELERSLEGNINWVRLPIMGYKTAALLALADLTTHVTSDHADAAASIVKRWAESASALEPFMRRKSSDLELDRLIESITSYIKGKGGTAYRMDVSRNLKLDSTTAKRVSDTLVEWGVITVQINDGQHIWSLTSLSN